MIITTKAKSAELIYKTRLVQHFEERLKVENSQTFWIKSAQDEDIKTLATAILIFSEKTFKTMEEVYDFIDDYLNENNDVSISTIYENLIVDINLKGFFGHKEEREAIIAKLNTPLMDMSSLMDKMANGLTTEMIQQARGQN